MIKSMLRVRGLGIRETCHVLHCMVLRYQINKGENDSLEQ